MPSPCAAHLDKIRGAGFSALKVTNELKDQLRAKDDEIMKLRKDVVHLQTQLIKAEDPQSSQSSSSSSSVGTSVEQRITALEEEKELNKDLKDQLSMAVDDFEGLEYEVDQLRQQQEEFDYKVDGLRQTYDLRVPELVRKVGELAGNLKKALQRIERLEEPSTPDEFSVNGSSSGSNDNPSHPGNGASSTPTTSAQDKDSAAELQDNPAPLLRGLETTAPPKETSDNLKHSLDETKDGKNAQTTGSGTLEPANKRRKEGG
ncbi:hypothetical protein BDZ90DRAFT_228785 [Jaminaea rosea]|uniref:Uncharacterized protein n=1 Tax=Jaminaea rosea TaxID=1569628 RepID=A0A316UN29_9BASI|nr:hypothetical protein BDZ90DRAFT_228785 [Jaminaea rosea]PWN24565.1 hypothetical protein BDZ90DRAFT_228785 [Jaminaea rosea]